MSVAHTLNVGCYRLAANVRLTHTENGGMVALCDYPLRVVPLNPTLARLLSLCTEERTCEQLATLMSMPLKRIEALLLVGLLFFPLNILIAIMLCIVTSVDYWRLKPSMKLVLWRVA